MPHDNLRTGRGKPAGAQDIDNNLNALGSTLKHRLIYGVVSDGPCIGRRLAG